MLSYAIKVGITASIVAASFAATAAAKPGKISTPDYLRDTFTVERVLDWGSRPIWSADSKRIVFTRDDKSPSPAYELDLKTRKVRCLTCRFEKADLVQRIYYLPDDSLLILGPPGLDAARPAPNTVQPGASELYWMPADASLPPQALDAPAFGEIALDYASLRGGPTRIAWGEFLTGMRMTVGSLVHDGKRASISDRSVVYTHPPADPASRVTFTETYDFLNAENAILFFTVEKGRPLNGMYKINLADGMISPMPTDGQHIETHLFPDTRYGLEESNRASDPSSPFRGMSGHPKNLAKILAAFSGVPDAAALSERYAGRTFDLYAVDFQTGERRRLTEVSDVGGQAHQSSTARNGKNIIFEMVAPQSGPFAGKSGLYLGTFSRKK